jgi:hypothetical protein
MEQAFALKQSQLPVTFEVEATLYDCDKQIKFRVALFEQRNVAVPANMINMVKGETAPIFSYKLKVSCFFSMKHNLFVPNFDLPSFMVLPFDVIELNKIRNLIIIGLDRHIKDYALGRKKVEDSIKDSYLEHELSNDPNYIPLDYFKLI